jgi:hypothetical protein
MALASTAGPYIFHYLLFTQLVAGDQQNTCADISSEGQFGFQNYYQSKPFPKMWIHGGLIVNEGVA